MITLGSLFDGIGGFPFDNETERLEQLSLLGPTMVGENVPRAFSSKDGEDFRTVLEETTRIVDDSISVPRPPGEGGSAGAILEDQFSVAGAYWMLGYVQLNITFLM